MDYKSRYISYLTALGYQAKTIQSKERRIAYFESRIYPKNIIKVNVTDIRNYYENLLESKSHCQIKTINKYLIDLDGFYSWCCLCGHIPVHPFGNFKPVKPEASGTRKPINEEIIDRLRKACETPQETLLLLLAYGCGLRAKELQQLKAKDILIERSLLVVRSGKMNKRRYIPLKSSHLKVITHFINNENLSPCDYFFSFENRQISQYLLRKLLKGLQRRIGLPTASFSLHHLRHSIASHLVEKGVDIQLVQLFLGHGKLETTQNYVSISLKESFYQQPEQKKRQHENTKTVGGTPREDDRENL